MRAGIPDPDTRRHTLTAYTDLGALAKDLAIENLDTIQLFLVDCSGTILWRAQGEPSAESLRSLDSATAASAGSEAVASTRAKEKVADYPRPPAIERVDRRLRAAVAGNVIAETDSPIRILETFHPPVYYTRPEDVDMQFLVPSPHTSFCEFKGEAHYYSLVVDGKKQSNVGWYYPHPSPGYEELANHVAFYAWALDEATIDGEQVVPQPGHFYGGWVTSDLEGPFKGEPGTMGW
ncbi:MAG: DUF427 domain-containing protein [Coriobacteriia bacterium]|nr:DUF427 domain-containing protein [Coriobacteriia bacterium]